MTDPGARSADATLHQQIPLAPREQEGTVGPYRIESVLGQGGMGQVLAVHDEKLRRTVAAKVALTRDPRALARFVQEAQVTGQLEHPAIVPVHEFGEESDGTPYFTMKRIAGRDLSALLESRELSLVERLEIFLKICDAMGFAHSKRVIHRDLKPANIMVGKYGEVLVVDWGLARLIDRDEAPPAHAPSVDDELDGTMRVKVDTRVLNRPNTGSSETMDGQIVGTPAYMPPEQARGELHRLSQRSDVYSLGAILYEMLAGVAPFRGKTAFEVIHKVVEDPLEPPSRHVGAVPRELDAVVLRAMEREPEDRYADVGALRADIVRFLEGRTLAAVSYSPWARAWKFVRRHRVASVAVAVVAVLLAGGLWREQARVRARLAAAIAEAEAEGARVPSAGVLREALKARNDNPPRTRLAQRDDAERWRVPLRAAMRRVGALDRALALSPADEGLRARRRAAGEAMGMVAMLSGDFTLASEAFDDLADFGGAERSRRLLAIAARHRGWLQEWRVRRLAVMIADLELGLASRERTHGDWRMDDYVFEAVGFRDAGCLALLTKTLDALTAKAAAPAKHDWTLAEREQVRFVCRVLGRLTLKGCAAPMIRFLEAVRDADLALEAGLGLCNTRAPEAFEPVMRVRARWGQESAIWSRLREFAVRLPEPASWSDEPRDADALFTRGKELLERGAGRRALADFDRGVKAYPDDWRFHNMRGIVHKRMGRFDRALADFDSVVRLQPRVPNGHVNRAVVLVSLGRFAEALKAYDAAIAMAPGANATISRRAYLHYQMGMSERDPTRRKACFERSLADCDRVLARDPDHASARWRRGVVRFNLGLAGARSDIDRAIALDPARASIWYDRAMIRMKGDLRGAISDLTAALERAPRYHEAYWRRALCYSRLGEDALAMSDYTQALALREQAPTYVNRGILYFKARDFERALADFGRARELRPRLWQANYNYGNALKELGRYAEAVEAYERALPLAPDSNARARCQSQLAYCRKRS